VDVQLWSGIFAPAATPAPIVAKLQKAFIAAVSDPGVSEKLRNMAVDPGRVSPEEFRHIIETDIVKFGDVVKAANLKFDE
jgi:tripartite-type tricarboxylate transporter receptor subunit TctC